MGTIRTYKSTEAEAIRLNLFADFCNAIFKANNMNEFITIEDIYFDYGQDWWYTSPITHGSDGDRWQTLCPRDYEVIIKCESTADLARYADYYVQARLNDEVCVNIKAIA